MGKPKKHIKKYNYQIDRKKEWKKSKKLPAIKCQQIKNAWDDKKSVFKNFDEMGLSSNPNETLTIPLAKDLIGPKDTSKCVKKDGKNKKSYVLSELEDEAAIPEERRLRMSGPDVDYCIYMLEKYGEDYEAMAMDKRNFYQDTPKQIARKIRVFRSIPQQYSNYLPSGMQS